jgi:Mrp family chromosome partitioning ATPase
MNGLLEVLKKSYKRIIIDSPPITAVTDAVVLAKSADGVVVVVRANDTAREIIQNGLVQLQSVGANILGAVLNGVDMGKDSYYYYQYYYYYYGEDEEKKRKGFRKKRRKNQYEEV